MTKSTLDLRKTYVAKKIYFNNTRVLIIEPELEQVIITTLENTPNIAQLLQEAKEVSPHKNIFTKYQETTYTIFTKRVLKRLFTVINWITLSKSFFLIKQPIFS